MNRLSLILSLSLLAGPAVAQTAHQDPPAQDYAASIQVQVLIAQARSLYSAAPQPLISQTLLGIKDYHVNLEYRAAKAPANINLAEEELFTVLDGAADIITGGTMPNAKQINSSTQEGGDIVGGKSRYLVRGDFVMVPRNFPYMFVPKGNTPLILVSVRLPGR